MTDTLFDHAFRRDIARLADAMEGLLALARAHVMPAAATAAPADRDSVQQAFDAMMGNPLQALGNLTAVAAPAAEPAKRKQAPRINWSKLDPRSRELAKLRTAAEHRAQAAKTTETRDAAALEAQKHHNESKARQRRLRLWLDAGKGIIDGDALCYFDAAGTKIKWVPSPTPHFFLPY
jgi:hypothetical protein